MNQTILTNAFAIYKAQCEAYNRPIVMDEFVFAMVPEQQYGEPIDLDEPLPPDSHIVGRFPVTQKGMLNPDAVIYSILLGTDIGTWDFNWIGLVNRERNLVGVITHTATQTKVKASPENGIEGDTLTRNIVTPYTNAAKLTQINVSADTWQLDFNQRLLAMDERSRQQNLDSYGAAAFIGDGWKVTPIDGALAVAAGCGYVHGLHCENNAQQVVGLAGEVLPKTLYLLASFKGSLNSAWETHTQLRFADALPNVSEVNGITQYAQAIARVHSPSHIEDLRPRTWREVHLDDSTDPHPQYNKRDASESETGAMAIATQQEVDDAINGNKAVTPKTLDKPGLLAKAKAYADKIKEDIYGGIPASTLDTIKEVADALQDTGSAVQSLFTKLGQLTTRVDTNRDNLSRHEQSNTAHTPQSVGAAPANHTHDYSPSNHGHTPESIGAADRNHGHDYAPSNHGHTPVSIGAADRNHSHDYSPSNHGHTPESIGAADRTHSHNYAASNHVHQASEIANIRTLVKTGSVSLTIRGGIESSLVVIDTGALASGRTFDPQSWQVMLKTEGRVDTGSPETMFWSFRPVVHFRQHWSAGNKVCIEIYGHGNAIVGAVTVEWFLFQRVI